MPWSCVRGARGMSWGLGPVPPPASLPCPPPFPRAPRVVCGGSFHPGVPYSRPLARHSMCVPCAFRGLGPVAPQVRPGGRGGRVGGGSAGDLHRPLFGPLFFFLGGCGGWLEGPGPDPPSGRLCGAARPPLQLARPGLLGVPGCRARPGGLAAGRSVPAVTPAHVPCG